MTNPRGLGRGLSALIPATDDATGGLRQVPLSEIRPNPRQPREVFDETELAELAASIREVGILQPLVVRTGEDGFELVAGERRLRAARIAGLHRVPVIVRQTGDAELLREALIENIHRAELNPLEEAAAYSQLLEDFGVTHEELAERVGKSRSTVTNSLRLLRLPAPVQRRVAAGVLSAGHAKALSGLDNADEQLRIAERIASEGLSVRATEELVRLTQQDGPRRGQGPRRTPTARNQGLTDLEERLSQALDARVQVKVGAKRGAMTIEFSDAEDLERIVAVIAEGLSADIPVREQPL